MNIKTVNIAICNTEEMKKGGSKTFNEGEAFKKKVLVYFLYNFSTIR